MTTNENPAAVRVCAIADIQCSRGCGTGACKREAESLQPAAAPIDRAEMVKSWGEISSQMFAKMTPWQFYEAGWVAACATVPAPSPADERAALSDQDIYDKFSFLEGLVNESTYMRIADTAIEIARAASASETGAEGAIELPHWFEMFLTNVCELPDRNSPEGEPDAIVATLDELRNCAINAIEQCISYAVPAPAMAAEAVAIPVGWKLVPIRPTGVMKDAGHWSLPVGVGGPWTAAAVYQAMIDTAPQSPAQAHPNVLLEQAACALESMGMKEMARIVRGDKIPNDGSTITQPAQPDAPAEAHEPIGPHDLNTSEGGRGYVAEFFVKRLRNRHYGRYIEERLAADFACALAQYLRDRDVAPQPAQADARVGLTDELRESVEHAATWLARSEDLQNKAHAERLRDLLQGANHD
ncbi:hypothetical protein ACTJLD_30475 [Burkholderia sp. 22088]|uniref:hypothetical protein n=1 Tax=Burkholderia sp. 22088 TaxID=3453871 RepID=UPI003F8494A4